MFKIGFFPHANAPAAPPLTPNYMYLPMSRYSGGTQYGYTFYTLSVTGTTTSQISFSWSLTSGTHLPKIYYYANYSGVTNTGATTIAALPLGTSNTPASIGFIEITSGAIINVNLGDYLTFVSFPSAGYAAGDLNRASGTIQDAGTLATIGTFDLRTLDL